jgi:hypothetical protein
VHVLADERDRLRLAIARELLEGVTVDERVFERDRLDVGEHEQLESVVSTLRPDVPPGVAGDFVLAEVGALGKLVDRRCRLRCVPFVAFDVAWTLGSLTAHCGKSANDAISVCLEGCGALGKDGSWADSFDQARIRLRSRGAGQQGAFVSWGAPSNPVSWNRSKRQPSVVDLQLLASALRGGEVETAEDACTVFEIPWPTAERDIVAQLRAEAAALAELYRVLVAALAVRAPGLAPSKVWSTGPLASHGLREADVERPWKKATSVSLDKRGAMASSFFGGPVQAALVGIACPMVLLDIRATYPWAFSASGMTGVYGSEEIIETPIDPDELSSLLGRPLSIEQLRLLGPVFAEIRPQGETLPATVEWRPDRIGSTIAPFDFSGGTACYHAADLRAGLLNDGRVPEFLRAWRLEFGHSESGRHRLRLPSERLIDLAGDNLGALLQEERLLAKDVSGKLGFDEYVKLLSVSLTFGLLARTDRKMSDAPVRQQGYGPAGEELCIETRHREELGPFSFLPAASAVCATARLAVASAKQVIEEDLGGSVAYISTDSLGIPASPTGGLWPCPGGACKLLDGREAIRLLSFDDVKAIMRNQMSDLGVHWNIEAETLEKETMGLVVGMNKLILARPRAEGGWKVVCSSDADMGGHMLDPTGKGAKTKDGRWVWGAEIEEAVFAANVDSDPLRPLVTGDLPEWAERLVLHRYRASKWDQLKSVRHAAADPSVGPYARYRVAETGGLAGGPVAIGGGDDPLAWPTEDWRVEGEPVCLVSLDGRFLGGTRGARRQVVVRTMADHLVRWLNEFDPSMQGPPRGFRHAVPVQSHPGMVRVVGKAGETLFEDKVDPEREPIAPRLVYGAPAVEELRYSAIALGRTELSRRTGMPESRYRRFLEGSATAEETLALVAEAVQAGSAPPRCAYPGCERQARPRSIACSEACRKALARSGGAPRH